MYDRISNYVQRSIYFMSQPYLQKETMKIEKKANRLS